MIISSLHFFIILKVGRFKRGKIELMNGFGDGIFIIFDFEIERPFEFNDFDSDFIIFQIAGHFG